MDPQTTNRLSASGRNQCVCSLTAHHNLTYITKTKRALLRRKRKDVNQGETAAVIITLLLVYFILAFTWKSWVPVLRKELASIHLKAKDLLQNPPYNVNPRDPMDLEMLLQLDDRLLRKILKIPELTEKNFEAPSKEQHAKGNALDKPLSELALL